MEPHFRLLWQDANFHSNTNKSLYNVKAPPATLDHLTHVCQMIADAKVYFLGCWNLALKDDTFFDILSDWSISVGSTCVLKFGTQF